MKRHKVDQLRKELDAALNSIYWTKQILKEWEKTLDVYKCTKRRFKNLRRGIKHAEQSSLEKILKRLDKYLAKGGEKNEEG